MKKIYSKLLFKLIDENMALHFPDFKPFSLLDKSMRTKKRSYCWSIDGVTKVFVEIWLHPSGQEKFYCNFAWTSVNDYPSVTDIFSGYEFPFLDPKSAFDHPEASDGIQRIWREQGTGGYEIQDPVSSFRAIDYQDKVVAAAEFARRCKLQSEMTEAEAMQLVMPPVEDLFENLKIHVIPYLREYAVHAQKRKFGPRLNSK